MSPRTRTVGPDAPAPRAVARPATAGSPDAATGSAPVTHRAARGDRVRDDAGGPVHRALAILELLGTPGGPSSLGVVEIARQLGRDKSQVSRLLKLLADAGFVDREEASLRYRIGTRLFAIGATAVERRLRDEAEATVEREAAVLGERVDVCIRSGASAMTIATAAPDSELRSAGWIGRTAPLSCTAPGRALLFDLDTATIARIIVPEGLGPAGPAAPRSLDELVSRVADDRRRGWSAARNETDRGLLALGAPVHDAGGAVVAAVGVSGPESRIDPAIDDVRAAVLRAASDLSTALGAVPNLARSPRARPAPQEGAS